MHKPCRVFSTNKMAVARHEQYNLIYFVLLTHLWSQIRPK